MTLIFIDAGTRDEHNLDLGARIFVRRLQTLGIACEHQVAGLRRRVAAHPRPSHGKGPFLCESRQRDRQEPKGNARDVLHAPRG